MGCAGSKLDDLPAVALCRERCGFLDLAIRHRYDLAQAHVTYMASMRGVGHSLREFLSHGGGGGGASGGHVLNLPPQKKGDRGVAAFANSPPKGSNHGDHLDFPSDSDASSLSDELHRSGGSSPLHGHDGHHIEYMSSDQEPPPGMGMGMGTGTGMGMGMGSYQGGDFLHMNYMKSKATSSVVYEQKPVTSETVYMGESSSSNYLPYPNSNSAPYPYSAYGNLGYGGSAGGYYGSQTNYGSLSPLRRQAEEKPPPAPPSPPQTSTWDFLNFFDDKFYPAYTPGRNSKELREEEGIPDLEDEHEVVKEVHGKPKFVDVGNHLKSVVVDDDEEEEEEDGKVHSGASTSMYQARPSVSIDNANDGAEYEVHMVEKKVVDGEGRSDEGGNASRFKGIRNVSELVREIEVQFERAAESGHEIAKMLEAGKVPYKRKGQAVSTKKAHGHTPSFSVVSAQPPSSKGAEPSASAGNAGPASLGFVEEMGMRSGNLSSTLHKLHLWEKKLYNEVKAEEKMRVIHDRKVQRLKHLVDSGAEATKKELTRNMIRSLSTKIRIAIQVVDKISVTINKIRDEELWPQINELIEGLMRMWKCLLECHRNQCQAMKEAQSFGPIGSARKLGDASPETLLQFQRELVNWANRFTSWVTAQKEYVRALNNWLLKCLLYEPEETADGVVPFSPGRIGAPPIFVICHQWSQAMDRISEKEVVTAMFGFTSSVFQLRERDKLEMRQRMMANKDLERVVRDLDREDQKIHKEIQALEKKISRNSGHGDIPSLTGQLVYQSDVSSSNNFQANLQRVFEAMERYTADSMQAYEELMQRSEEEIKIAQERVGVS
ncbi:protein ALTERED PHOSPHATE STARVATION RESPONSE 1-like isoform X1 [Syzygium oleosum]|uniref:protein ALTERED PHOSPHATE STARVATION RESPONSE 1-like isoform X1 n=1 Tax=Syzygium oleosum TaxID=219896 RepID=UPI0024BAA2E3|nr:protein ALTERED PHOSPHATE STARVATION RESPONSE 1-like isoform X1 [Syzygium oleosum]